MLTITKTLLEECGEKFMDGSVTDEELADVMEQLRSSSRYYYKMNQPITDRNHSPQQAVRDFVSRIAGVMPEATLHDLVTRLIALEHESTRKGNTVTEGDQAGKNLGIMRNASLAKSFYEYEMAHYQATAEARMEEPPMDAVKPHWEILLSEGMRIFRGQEAFVTQPETKEEIVAEKIEEGTLRTNIANTKHAVLVQAQAYFDQGKINDTLYGQIRQASEGLVVHNEGAREQFKALIERIDDIEQQPQTGSLLDRMKDMLHLSAPQNTTQKFSDALRTLKEEVDKLDKHSSNRPAGGA
ncbi:MAG: hypothetical protein P1U32_07285 [Legionellaceae bacterium]|nr:hypothetical protein [Legionellaceae bacterium]